MHRSISFHAIIFDEIYAVFAATSGAAGLGFSSGDIAFSLSLMGPCILVAQLVLFPHLNNCFSTLTLWRFSAAVLAIAYPLFSLLPHVANSQHGEGRTGLWICLLILLAVRFTANVVGYTSMAVLVRVASRPQCRW